MNKVVMTKPTVKQTAVIRFMSDKSVQLTLTGVDGVTGRMLDTASKALATELNIQRSKIRTIDTAEQHRRAELERTKAVQPKRDAQQGDL